MDKYEYRIKADAIKSLIAEGDYPSAMEIADEIDWRRVKSVMMLCTISDLYKINRRLEDSRDLLLLAYGRHPGGRTIVFSLCELSIKMGDYLLAKEYYQEFLQIAPNDSGQYILKYKLYEALEVNLEERIKALQELKQEDYREKWAFELAKLYHRAGMVQECVAECDELILWFGEGKYVDKALDLKLMHAPLTPDQQAKYDARFAVEEPASEPVKEAPQAAEPKLAEAVQESQPESAPEDEIHVKTMDVGEYNTINLQKEIAEGLKEVLNAPQDAHEAITQSIVAPMLQNTTQMAPEEVEEVISQQEEAVETEVFFGETSEMKVGNVEEITWQAQEASVTVKEIESPATEEEPALPAEESQPVEEEEKENDTTGKAVMEDMRKARQAVAEPPKELANVLSMESDGQIRLIMPKEEAVEKQITGQMSIEDILAEWERMKNENKEKREAEVRQRVLQRTGPMFTEYEAKMRDSLLEQLEADKVTAPAVMKLTDIEPEEDYGEIAMEAIPEETFEEEMVVKEEKNISEEVQEPEEEEPAEEVIIEDLIIEDLSEGDEQTEEPMEESDGSDSEVEELEEITDIGESLAEEAVVEEKPAAEEAVKEAETATEEAQKPAGEAPEEEKSAVRTLTREERALFSPYIQSKSSKEQLIRVLDGVSMAAYTGNVIVTGPEGVNTMGLAKNIVRDVQASDNNFSGKTAKISGHSLETRDIMELTKDLANGALIIQKAAGMSEKSAEELYKALQQEHLGILVIMEDTKKAMNRFLEKHPKYTNCFTARMDVDALSDEALVAFARKYAREMEYSIDDFGILELHTRIDEMQTSDHVVTVLEVKEMVDAAIRHANRKNLTHFFDILLGKRYDREDMIILREKDFA
ncbi:MAG: hypothetical protein IJZ82_02430 [Lachnospiraceae bacterium]|nr:hypothetical protein [Lachnospiraceae bacterium]